MVRELDVREKWTPNWTHFGEKYDLIVIKVDFGCRITAGTTRHRDRCTFSTCWAWWALTRYYNRTSSIFTPTSRRLDPTGNECSNCRGSRFWLHGNLWRPQKLAACDGFTENSWRLKMQDMQQFAMKGFTAKSERAIKIFMSLAKYRFYAFFSL